MEGEVRLAQVSELLDELVVAGERVRATTDGARVWVARQERAAARLARVRDVVCGRKVEQVPGDETVGLVGNALLWARGEHGNEALGMGILEVLNPSLEAVPWVLVGMILLTVGRVRGCLNLGQNFVLELFRDSVLELGFPFCRCAWQGAVRVGRWSGEQRVEFGAFLPELGRVLEGTADQWDGWTVRVKRELAVLWKHLDGPCHGSHEGSTVVGQA